MPHPVLNTIVIGAITVGAIAIIGYSLYKTLEEPMMHSYPGEFKQQKQEYEEYYPEHYQLIVTLRESKKDLLTQFQALQANFQSQDKEQLRNAFIHFNETVVELGVEKSVGLLDAALFFEDLPEYEPVGNMSHSGVESEEEPLISTAALHPAVEPHFAPAPVEPLISVEDAEQFKIPAVQPLVSLFEPTEPLANPSEPLVNPFEATTDENTAEQTSIQNPVEATHDETPVAEAPMSDETPVQEKADLMIATDSQQEKIEPLSGSESWHTGSIKSPGQHHQRLVSVDSMDSKDMFFESKISTPIIIPSVSESVDDPLALSTVSLATTQDEWEHI
ncbi:hypothetical protein EDD86DRAFT_200523 [Gorgonomyces haynaldii]|nr:hypothetical protein EDD86DRAFT_200523 [Gorgonomyces haynaldii]